MRRIILLVTVLVVAAAGCSDAAAPHSEDSTPLSVRDALRTRPSGVIEVRGNVIVHPDGSARLCEGLAGSYPPQCGGESVAIAGFDPRVLEHPDSAGGVTWGQALLRGQLDGDVFRLN